jgi:hypothetical protein
MQISKTASCKQHFKALLILPLPSLFIYEILVYIKSNLNDFTANSGYHTHNTRKKDDLYIVPCNTSLYKNNNSNIELRLLNHLPQNLKGIAAPHKFKKALKTYLLRHCFYSVEEFLLFGPNTKFNHLTHNS